MNERTRPVARTHMANSQEAGVAPVLDVPSDPELSPMIDWAGTIDHDVVDALTDQAIDRLLEALSNVK